ncbi:MAG TPA: hypothetical protein PKV16_03165 [Caldisericia bacterium]|nr:hypothetical protein [Caldisericia bacterium]HPF48311.1 hypothetical protein [Caldisericia bacterium]HPI83510.1 hypothetical protein [Caldisericia bacterium]HPQ92764.1 hypothetical protein [Caldisericia bacterium]HRV74138.1 hypothetical protein [Caldisericia bacterium]
MNTKRLISIVLTAFLVSAIVGCGEQQGQDFNLKHYTGSFFSIDYPEGYTPTVITQTNPGVVFNSRDSNMTIEVYSNTNPDSIKGDTYRLKYNGDDYWDELESVDNAEYPHLLVSSYDHFEWPIMIATFPLDGWELIATVMDYSKEDYALAKAILESVEITNEDFTAGIDKPQYEAFDFTIGADSTSPVHETDSFSIRANGKQVSVDTNSMLIECDGYSISIDSIYETTAREGNLGLLKKTINSKLVEMGHVVAKEILQNGLKSIYYETLVEEEKNITIGIPVSEGIIFINAKGMKTREQIQEAGSSLLSFELKDKEMFSFR